MRYREALKRTAVVLATNWQHVPRHMAQAWTEFLPFANAVLVLVALIASPVLVILSPLIALLAIVDDRKWNRDKEAAIKRMNEHYGSRSQEL